MIVSKKVNNDILQKEHVDDITCNGCINTGNHITMHDGYTQTDNTNYGVLEKDQVESNIYNNDVKKKGMNTMIESEYKYKYNIYTGLIEFTNGYQKREDIVSIMVDIDDNGFIPYFDERTWFDYQALYKRANCIVSGLDI